MNQLNTTLFEDIISDDEHFESKLNNCKPITIKWGADPSAPDLHLGHFVILNQLANFQKLGHQILFIIGDLPHELGIQRVNRPHVNHYQKMM